MKRGLRLWAIGILVGAGLLSVSPAAFAESFDTDAYVPALVSNYWPWGDAQNQRYQLWFSGDMLSDAGFSGTINSIEHFIAPYTSSRDSGYDLDIYASNTPVGSLTADFDSNHGVDKTLIFSGSLSLASASSLFINVNPVFNYDGSSNLLLDYVFKGFTGVGAYYDGPLWQAVDMNDDLLRVTSHSEEGDGVYDWGALRTQLNATTTPVPEPISSALFLLGAGAFGLRLRRRKS